MTSEFFKDNQLEDILLRMKTAFRHYNSIPEKIHVQREIQQTSGQRKLAKKIGQN